MSNETRTHKSTATRIEPLPDEALALTASATSALANLRSVARSARLLADTIHQRAEAIIENAVVTDEFSEEDLLADVEALAARAASVTRWATEATVLTATLRARDERAEAL
jgi:hypothetical protein